MAGQPLIQALEHVPVDLGIRDVGEAVVLLLDGLEVDNADVPLHNGPVEGVLDLLRPLVAVVAVAELDIVPHGEDPDHIVVRGPGDVLHAGLHDVLPLDVGLDEAHGDIVALDIVQGKGVLPVVVAHHGLAAGDDIVRGDAVLLIALQHRLGVACVVAAVVAEGAGHDGHAQALDGLHLLGHQAQGDVHELGGLDLPALHEALVHGGVVAGGGAVEGVVHRAVEENIGLLPLVQEHYVPAVEAALHRVHHEPGRLPAGDLDQHVKAVIAVALDVLDKGGGVALRPVGVLDHLVHHGGGDRQGGVLHQGDEALLCQAHLGDAHVPELGQPPGHVVVALLGQQLQLVVVQDNVVGLIVGLRPPAHGDNRRADRHGQGQQDEEDSVCLDVLLHGGSFRICCSVGSLWAVFLVWMKKNRPKNRF